MEKKKLLAIQSTTLKVYKPQDFIYCNDLGAGAFGKVRKCKIKKGVEAKTINNPIIYNDDAQTADDTTNSVNLSDHENLENIETATNCTDTK